MRTISINLLKRLHGTLLSFEICYYQSFVLLFFAESGLGLLDFLFKLPFQLIPRVRYPLPLRRSLRFVHLFFLSESTVGVYLDFLRLAPGSIQLLLQL